MATVTRRIKLVNPAKRRRNLSPAQIRAGFGGKRRQSAMTAKRSNARRPKKINRITHRRRTRKNISGIAVASLPAMNPARKRSNKVSAKAKKNTRRQSSAPKRSNWRQKPKANRHHKRRTHRRRSNPTATKVVTRWKLRNRSAKVNRHRGRKRNPGGESTTGLLWTSICGAAGAVGSRVLPQVILGASNTGFVGYGANIAAGLVLGWAGRKFISRQAGNAAMVGAGIALVLRLTQDFIPGPVSSYVQSGGLGDLGVGALMPSNFIEPPVYTGNGANQRIPPAWQPAALPPATAGKGVGSLTSTYGFSTYGR